MTPTGQGNPGLKEAARPAEAIPEEDRGTTGEGECCQGPASDGVSAQDRELAKKLLQEGRKDRAKLLLRSRYVSHIQVLKPIKPIKGQQKLEIIK